MSSSTDDSEAIFGAMAWIMNGITLTTGILFLWSRSRTPMKSKALYLTMILNLVDLIFPSINVLTIIFFDHDSTLTFILTGIIYFFYQFTIYWTAALAIFSYLILSWKKSLNLRVFASRSLTCCALLSLAFPIMIWSGAFGIYVTRRAAGVYSVMYSTGNAVDKITYFIAFEIYGLFLPIIVTTYCYIRVYKVLNQIYCMPFIRSQLKTYRVLWYAFIPVVCFLPEFFAASYGLIASVHFSMPLAVAMSVLHRSWNFINLLAYWFLQPADQDNQRDSDIDSDSMNRSISMPQRALKEERICI